mmetsp:Transcript_27123/g.83294  ORF Transcript_27123/g.83294 Transcript_27123/m.83294 type:complete len:90 (-) Transcript_27123:243-512(-)
MQRHLLFWDFSRPGSLSRLADDASPADDSMLRGFGRASPDVGAPKVEEVDEREAEGRVEVRSGDSSTIPVAVADDGESTMTAPLADVVR